MNTAPSDRGGATALPKRRSVAGVGAALARLVGGVLVLVLLLEGAARVLAGPPPGEQPPQVCPAEGWCNPSRNTRQPHPVMRWEHRAHFTEWVPVVEHPDGGFWFHTNGFGLRRDTEVAIPKPPGVFRVVVLGDSQTEGFVNNDQHYPYLLEQQLQPPAGYAVVEALNAGVGGYEAPNQYFWYAVHGATLQPDVIVWPLYLGNDLAEVTLLGTPDAYVPGDGRLSWGALTRYQLRLLRGWLLDHSRLLGVLRNRSLHGERPAREVPPDAPEAPLNALVRDCWGCLFQHHSQRPWTSDERVTVTRARLTEFMERLRDQAAAQGARLLVLPLPSKVMVEPDDEREGIARTIDAMRLTPAEVASYDMTREIVLQAAASAGVLAFDPLAELQEAARRDRLYYRRDWHLNPAGHRQLAELLAGALRQNELVAAP